MNTDELELALLEAERKVLKVQTKLHGWARDDPHRRFSDLFNLVAEFTSTGVVYGVADPAVTDLSGARRVGVT